MRDYSSIPSQAAFTLIELSIVLVIIGLIVGGVLVGQNLIAASQVRATITQVEKYNQAANTFYGKYGYLPGDIKDPEASGFGFAPRGSYAGEGDGNGIIEGVAANSPNQNLGYIADTGETAMFWVDLSVARLIDGNFNSASLTTSPGLLSGTALNKYYPTARLGNGNYFYVYSRAPTFGGLNMFGLSAISSDTGIPLSTPGLTVQQAYSIDTKVDDGLPQSGNIGAFFLNRASGSNAPIWAAGGGNIGAHGLIAGGETATTNATSGSSLTCYDNGNSSGAPQQYSIAQNGGANVNCALSFRFQ